MGAMMAVGLGVASAGSQIWGGYQQKKEAERNAQAIQQESIYNAGIYRQQADMVEQQKQLKMQQDARKIRFVEGKHTAITAAKGIEMSGSAMAVLIDTMTQLEMDKSIEAYNYDVKKYSLESQAQATRARGYTLAAQYRSGGKTAMMQGWIGGLTTLASTAMWGAKRIPGKAITTNLGAKSASMGSQPSSYWRNAMAKRYGG
jgi:hypothetical protein